MSRAAASRACQSAIAATGAATIHWPRLTSRMLKSQSSRKPAPQCGQLVRWKRLPRIASRRSGRRSALRLCTVSNESDRAQDGQSMTVSLNRDMALLLSGRLRLGLELGQPLRRGMRGIELLHVIRRVQLGEPFPGGAELVAGDALGPGRVLVADPTARVTLVVDHAVGGGALLRDGGVVPRILV